MTLPANTHEIRPNQAKAPAAITAIAAIGVRIVNISCDKEVAPDVKGPAKASSGLKKVSPTTVSKAMELLGSFISVLRVNTGFQWFALTIVIQFQGHGWLSYCFF